MEAQRASVRAYVAAQGWTLVAEHEDVASGKDDHRPGFRAALGRCRQLGAVLVAVPLDRITRRVDPVAATSCALSCLPDTKAVSAGKSDAA